MFYSMPYYKNAAYINEVDEIILQTEPKDYEAATAFLSKHIHQRVVFYSNQDPKDYNNIVIYKKLMQDYPQHRNWTICANCDKSDIIRYDTIYSLEHIPHFFSYFPKNLSDFYMMATTLDITDIFITENLGFCIQQLKEKVREELGKNILFRVFPNVCQSSWVREPFAKQFFIRPEDIPIYEPYVDICDLSYDQYGPNNKGRADILYKIYAKDKKWSGDIGELIIGIPKNVVDSRCFPSIFATRRVSCNKDCYLRPNCGCAICDNTIAYAQVLHEKYIKGKEEEDGELR